MASRDSYIPVNYEQLTSISAATALTAAKYNPTSNVQAADIAIICPETSDVRWRDDGTDPTASVGMPITAGDYFEYRGDLSKVKFIQQAASGKLNVAYFREA